MSSNNHGFRNSDQNNLFRLLPRLHCITIDIRVDSNIYGITCHDCSKHTVIMYVGLAMVNVWSKLHFHIFRFDSIRFDSIRFDSIRFDSIQFNSLNSLNSIQFNSIQFNSIQFNSIQFNSIQFNSIQFNSPILFYSILFNFPIH